MFFKGSRYEKVEEAEITDRNGRTIRYKKIRFIATPQTDTTHIVRQGERLDSIAFDHFRDPERFWRICDLNLAMWPDDLLEVGATLLIPPSEE